VPIRIEVGPRDVVNNTVRLVRRDNGEKEDVSMQDATFRVASLLGDIQASMLARAERERDAGVMRAEDWETFACALAAKRLALSPSCSSAACEEEVGKRSKTIATTAGQVSERVRGERVTDATRIEAQASEGGEEAEAEAEAEGKMTGSAKALCIPLDQEGLAPGARCFACDLPARCLILWGRSY
jgi:prolyl-tRNA synthetase